ncbi:IscS subfamily cysteine desulfurase [Bacillus aquiflavi]|uniref:Aminotransferase class V-fold PLP-dependent enzyme n=1 Tax=Bacillus aquiflavi TaxID=2672567 RepID=A0A6B3VWQ2_9BACI|nr:IscS subfamily cysteine desulfurase [Bacillus aquiflavi]MBA4537184.1 IscS subfamily cysteine desulfurase [Bacillus aquiflavi]NEY81442.1 aminotransferase class V-fold PLP-dependent enzyme [Bacillus aquiflavi]UAC47404.1 IscS subfamily cysteine desulfurase [Bacillus aquiflavi]
MKYFDHAATSPIDDDALLTYVKVSKEFFGNTNSLHDAGGAANSLLEQCRAELANILAVNKRGIYFTSGGTESNIIAIYALLSAKKHSGNHIITSLGEHSSIMNIMKRLETEGFRISYLPFTSNGTIDVEAFKKEITPETVLAIIQNGNSEIGTIQPIREIARICKNEKIYFHTDCVQTFGKIDLKPVATIVDSLSISGHKFNGPKGVGALFIHPAIATKPLFPNGTHERGVRSGTVNLPGIAAMTVAAQKSVQQLNINKEHYKKLRQSFLTYLQPINDRTRVFGSTSDEQLPGIVGLAITGIEGQWIMLECNRLGFAISTGSACQVGKQALANSMLALKVNKQTSKEFIRISFGTDTTVEDVKQLADSLIHIVSGK